MKLEKAEGGKSINWVGATLTALDVLSGVGAANAGAGTRHSGKLLHTCRFKAALRWIEALLREVNQHHYRAFYQHGALQSRPRLQPTPRPGGVLRAEGRPTECFSPMPPPAALARFKAETGLSKFNTAWEGQAPLIVIRSASEGQVGQHRRPVHDRQCQGNVCRAEHSGERIRIGPSRSRSTG